LRLASAHDSYWIEQLDIQRKDAGAGKREVLGELLPEAKRPAEAAREHASTTNDW
jgi:hypothetical protein